MWSCLAVPSLARSTGVPRDSPAFGCRFRWGASFDSAPRDCTYTIYEHLVGVKRVKDDGVIRCWGDRERRGVGVSGWQGVRRNGEAGCRFLLAACTS